VNIALVDFFRFFFLVDFSFLFRGLLVYCLIEIMELILIKLLLNK